MGESLVTDIFNLEAAITAGAGFAEQPLAHIPGGFVIHDIAMTFFSPTAAATDVVLSFQLFQPEGGGPVALSSPGVEGEVLARGQIEPLVYDRRIDIPSVRIGPPGHLQPLYVLWRQVAGVPAGIGSLLTTLVLRSEAVPGSGVSSEPDAVEERIDVPAEWQPYLGRSNA